jgi:precorrin-6B methylase 2
MATVLVTIKVGAGRTMLEAGHTIRKARLSALALTTAALIAISAGAYAQRTERPALDVPYVPTPPEVVERMLEMAGVKPDDFVIDLGSGDGRIAIAAAKKGARAFGVDIDPERVQEAEENARKAGVQDKVSFKRQNLFETRISDASVLTMYLLTKVNLDLRPRILEELKPGTRVVSHAFDLGDWKADQHSEIGHRQVFMWVVPAKAAGRWQVEAGNERFSLVLDQRYQNLTGQAQIGGQAVAVREGWLRGAEIRFTLADGRKFHGRVDGDRMEAAPAGSGGDKAAIEWRATRE